MDPNRHGNDVRDLRAALMRQQVLCLVLSLITLVLAFGVVGKKTTTILEPPTRARTIAIEGDHVDAEWLEEMGAWIAHMMLAATPHSIRWQQEQILKWTHPSFHGELQDRMTVQAKRLEESNATTVFWPEQIAPDPDHTRVLVLGQLETYVNSMKVPGEHTVAYVAAFQSMGGRVLLKQWQAVPLDDPWLEKAADAAQHAKDQPQKESQK